MKRTRLTVIYSAVYLLACLGLVVARTDFPFLGLLAFPFGCVLGVLLFDAREPFPGEILLLVLALILTLSCGDMRPHPFILRVTGPDKPAK